MFPERANLSIVYERNEKESFTVQISIYGQPVSYHGKIVARLDEGFVVERTTYGRLDADDLVMVVRSVTGAPPGGHARSAVFWFMGDRRDVERAADAVDVKAVLTVLKRERARARGEARSR
jgi:hypothetical protein